MGEGSKRLQVGKGEVKMGIIVGQWTLKADQWSHEGWITQSQLAATVVATRDLVAIDRTNCVCCTSRGPREVQNCGRWLQKLNAHAQSVLGAIQHCFAPLDTSRGDERCSTHNWDWHKSAGWKVTFSIFALVNFYWKLCKDVMENCLIYINAEGPS